MRILDTSCSTSSTSINQNLSLTNLRKSWCARDCLISEFLNFLVDYQDVPGPIPGEPVVTDSGRNWVSLSWGKPEHRGAAPVVAYRVDIWLGGGEGARWTELGIAGSNTYDAFNLKPDAEYKFRITPRNRYGWGEPVQSGPIVLGRHTELPEFTKILPGQLKGLLGSNISLECEVRGEPTPCIRWYHNEDEIDVEEKDRYNIVSNGKLCNLTISNLQENDAGRFMCEATNKAGRVSTFAWLSVVDDPKILKADAELKRIQESATAIGAPPQFTMRLRDRRVQITYPVRLSCQIVGFPVPDVIWTRDGERVVEDDRHKLLIEDQFYTLEITKTVLEDIGTYTVAAKNVHGSVTCRSKLIVDKGIRAYIAPDFYCQLEPATVTLKQGEELRLTAQIEAYPAVTVMWYRNGTRLRPSRKAVMTLAPDGRVQLALAGIKLRDAGIYTCVATNEVGRTETSAKVEVTDEEVVETTTIDDEVVETVPEPPRDIPYSKEPKFLKKPMSTEAYEGDNIIILCEVIGDPKPEVVWLRDFLKPDYYRDAPHFHRIGDGPEYLLEIPQAKLDYTGTYTVFAKNCHGDTKAIISLQIKAKGIDGKPESMDQKKFSKVQTVPKIVRELKDIRCCDGDAVTLECEVEASPAPDVRWEKRGKLIRLGEDFRAEFDGKIAKLIVNQIFPEDEGEYTCVAYNELGKAFTSACLLVDVPEEKDNVLTQTLQRPAGLTPGSTPRSTPRTTPVRSLSPRRQREPFPADIRPRRLRAIAPKFYAIPHNRVAEEGETVRFQCSVAGHPEPWATWTKDGATVTSSSRITIKEQDDLRILEIVEVKPDDSGLYRVSVENNIGKIEASARLDVITHRGFSMRGLRARSASPRPEPTFSRRLVGISAGYGGRTRFDCEIHASIPTPYIRWYKDGVPVEGSEKYTLTKDGNLASLEVNDIKVEDSGTYSCIVENKNGSDVTSAKLEVVGVNLEKLEALKFVKELPRQKKAIEGKPLQLEAKVTGTKPYDVIWMKDGCVLPECEDFQQINLEDGRIILKLPDVFAQDSGDYRCEVYNPFGEAMSKCRIIVQESTTTSPTLEFLKTPAPVITSPGNSASFCARIRTTGDERPQITWEVAGVPVKLSDKFQVEEVDDVSILHIFGVTHLDGGQVSCIARLPSQEKSRDTVCGENASSRTNDSDLENYPFASDTDQLCISCSTELTVIPDIDSFGGVSNDNRLVSDSGAKSMAANGSSAEVSGDHEKKSKRIDEPAMLLKGPQDTIALVGDRVLLKAAYMGHPEPTVRWNRAGKELKNDERTSIMSADGVSCLLLQNINNDDSGKYDVCVENIHGADCHYASVSVEGPPDPPGGRPSVIAGIDSATVTWSSSPYDGGKIVTGFALEYSLVGSDIWTTAVDNCHSLSYTIKGLQPGARYVFRVRAINVHGSSQPGTESYSVRMKEPDESSTFEPRQVVLEPGPEFKNRYEVLEELGKGRYGVVHKVIDKSTSQKLAAKFVRCRTAKDREKVQDEIDIMNTLRHQKLLQLAAAFENPKETVMIMEYISGGELFERVVADDFTLTEKDCIIFMRQICEGVAYMHSQNIVHLDLKPENIMCHTRTSHEVKIIDFGLAQKLTPNTPIRVLFGTPEFIPPEIINYEPIGTQSDMWSVGVICYVLLSGLSPFMGDNDAETFANITRAYYDFEDEAFDAVSQNARDFISALLVKRKENRLSAEKCLKHIWLDPDSHHKTVVLCTDKLKKFIIRRKWQKTGNAIRALGRMASLSASRRNSASASNSPRPSLSGNVVSRMSSLSEESSIKNDSVVTNGVCKEFECNTNKAKSDTKIYQNGNSLKYLPLTEEIDTGSNLIIEKQGKEDVTSKHVKSCSERSDSGFIDCSAAISCSCTPTLLTKKFCINEEQYENANFENNTQNVLYVDQEIENVKNNIIDDMVTSKNNPSTLLNGKNNMNATANADEEKFTSNLVLINNNNTDTKKSEVTSTRIFSEPPSHTFSANKGHKPESNLRNKIERFDISKIGETKKGKSPATTNGLRSITSSNTVANVIKKFEQIEKTTTKPQSQLSQNSSVITKNSLHFSSHKPLNAQNKYPTCDRKTKSSKLTITLNNNGTSNNKIIQKSPEFPKKEISARRQFPSPSLLRKTQAVIAKEQSNDFLTRQTSSASKLKVNCQSKISSQKINSVKNSSSPPFGRKMKTSGKPKSESFQKAAAFWNK